MKPQDLRMAAQYIRQIEEAVKVISDNGKWSLEIPHGNMNRDVLTMVRAAFADRFAIDHAIDAQPMVKPYEGLTIWSEAALASRGRTLQSPPSDHLFWYEMVVVPYREPLPQRPIPTHAMSGLGAFRGSIQRPW